MKLQDLVGNHILSGGFNFLKYGNENRSDLENTILVLDDIKYVITGNVSDFYNSYLQGVAIENFRIKSVSPIDVYCEMINIDIENPGAKCEILRIVDIATKEIVLKIGTCHFINSGSTYWENYWYPKFFENVNMLKSLEYIVECGENGQITFDQVLKYSRELIEREKIILKHKESFSKESFVKGKVKYMP